MADNKYERIFCAEQINVPADLPAILKQLTKAVRTSAVFPLAMRLSKYRRPVVLCRAALARWPL